MSTLRRPHTDLYRSAIVGLETSGAFRHFPAVSFPMIHPVGWLTSHFAVGGFSPLRRLSGMLTAHMTEIAPHSGFSWHPHRGLEIYTYVISGSLYHEDSTGGHGVIRAGDVQRMFSGDYIEHQELNRFDEPARVIQIWFAADQAHRGLPPHYEQVGLADMPPRANGDAEVRDIVGPAGATHGHVSARLTATQVPAGGWAELERPSAEEDLLLYVVDGSGFISDASDVRSLGLYDVVVASPDVPRIEFMASDRPLTYLSFYLFPFLSSR